ncbi:MAG: ribonuclease J [Lachnospiraceae bacterium]|nr:ribonuclease J [Lachnospiraceae bacterium]MBR4781230.1 ribonuclease J [Lachnospiraceae bacterium]
MEEVKKAPKVKVIPLGGLEQIGMNITAFEYDDSIIVVDCGIAFPEDEMLGIDLVIPDITYLKDNIDKVKGFFITHGHEDHIGALPYVLKEICVPVYGTCLTMALIENKLREHEMPKKLKLRTVKYGQSVTAGDFRIEFIRTNHSIADAAALAIFSPAGIIVHTGDFKVDFTPVFGETIDLARLSELGKKGVLALLCDSTNILRPGYTMSERTVGKTFDTIFMENNSSRIIVATFSTNVDRVQQIINSAEKYGRKVVIEGRSMINVITLASELGYIKVKDGTIIPIETMKSYKDEQIVIITTGSQGEAMAALSRMAANIHKKVTIKPGDLVIFSSSAIPGNEKNIFKVINELSMIGAKVIFQDAHVSGHACKEEIKLIYSLVKPKYAIPVHGEYRFLVAHKELAVSMGMDKDNVFILSSGDVAELSADEGQIVDHVKVGAVMVDGLGVGDVGNIVLRDRQQLSESGLLVVSVTLDSATGEVVAGPEINSRGFVYVKDAEELFTDLENHVIMNLDSIRGRGITDQNKMKSLIRDDLTDFLWKKMKRRPIIIPVFMEV